MKERSKFSGMTVNERLYEAGLMDAYDKAKAKQDLTQLQRIASEITEECNRVSLDQSAKTLGTGSIFDREPEKRHSSNVLTDGDLEACLFIAECRAVNSYSPSSLADVGANAPGEWIDETFLALQSGTHDQTKNRSSMIPAARLLDASVLRKPVPKGGA